MDDPLPPDPYKALGVPKDAPLAAVRSAHRKLVLTCHPDKVTEESAKKAAADRFHLVQQAYEILSDETRRQRYDERIKLAELRADVMSQKNGRIIPERAPQTKTTTFEMRGDRLYEERAPAPRRSYDDDRVDDYFQPRYQEVRPRRQDDRPFVLSPRKTSGRASDDKRRAKEMAREYEEDRDRRRKEAEKAARSDRNKRRDRDKKRDTEYKSRSRHAYAESDTDSDSDVTERVHTRREEPPRRRYEDDMRRPELPRRNTKREEYDYDDYDSKHILAQDYIAQSRGSSNRESSRPSPTSRAYSHVEARPPPTPKLPPTPLIDPNGRRGSGRGSSRREPSPPPRLSKKDRRPTEIVDPPPLTRRPKLQDYSSDPNGLKIPITPNRKEPFRSQTLDTVPEKRHPSIKRAETMPVDKSYRSENQPAKPSKLKEQHDSGYSSRSSRGTPDLSPTDNIPPRSTKYKIYDESSDSDESVTIVDEPGGGYQRVSEMTPKPRRPPLTPHSASRVQMPSMRSGSFAPSSDQPPTPRTAPPIIRTESGRPPPPRARASTRGAAPLWGELQPSDELPYRVISQSPKISRDNISYASRRGSEDVERDAYPGSHRPGFSRSESRAVHT